jgi:hypothetical protein
LSTAPIVLYRVVAIRPDGTRVILATNLTKDRAQAIVDSLSGVSAFAEIHCEPQPPDEASGR